MIIWSFNHQIIKTWYADVWLWGSPAPGARRRCRGGRRRPGPRSPAALAGPTPLALRLAAWGPDFSLSEGPASGGCRQPEWRRTVAASTWTSSHGPSHGWLSFPGPGPPGPVGRGRRQLRGLRVTSHGPRLPGPARAQAGPLAGAPSQAQWSRFLSLSVRLPSSKGCLQVFTCMALGGRGHSGCQCLAPRRRRRPGGARAGRRALQPESDGSGLLLRVLIALFTTAVSGPPTNWPWLIFRVTGYRDCVTSPGPAGPSESRVTVTRMKFFWAGPRFLKFKMVASSADRLRNLVRSIVSFAWNDWSHKPMICCYWDHLSLKRDQDRSLMI
jgi:hypothetical protein